jgi:phage-related protein
MDSLTGKAGSTCDIFGTMGTMVSAQTKAMFAAIQKGITDAMAKIGKVLKSITDMVAKVANKIKQFVTGLTSAIIARINAIVAKISSVITAAVAKIKGFIADVIGVIDGLASALGKAVRGIIAAGCTLVKNAATAIGSGVSDMIDSVTSKDEFPAEAGIKAAADKALGSVGASNLALDSMSFDSSALAELDAI